MDNIQLQIREKLSELNISLFFKIYLFGMTGKSFSASHAPVAVKPEAQDSPEKKSAREIYTDIAGKIDSWLASGINYLSDFSMEELSVEIDISKRSLARYFEKHLKKNFREWKSDLRIEKAKKLILEKEENACLEDIAYTVGFRDKSNFHRQFKRRTGCTPGQWRRCRGNPEFQD